MASSEPAQKRARVDGSTADGVAPRAIATAPGSGAGSSSGMGMGPLSASALDSHESHPDFSSGSTDDIAFSHGNSSAQNYFASSGAPPDRRTSAADLRSFVESDSNIQRSRLRFRNHCESIQRAQEEFEFDVNHLATTETPVVERFRQFLLPLAVMRKVFSYLRQRDVIHCREVCRTWRKTAGHFLQKLDLSLASNISDAKLSEILSRTPWLKSINLGYCQGVTGVGLEHLYHLASLEEINLSHASGIRDVQSICSLLRSCLNVKYLYLDVGLRQSLEDCHMEAIADLDLVELYLDGNSKVSSEGVASLARCTRLRKLSLQHLDKVDEAGLGALGSLPDLKTLNLAHCFGVNDNAIDIILKFPSLKELNLCCVRLSLPVVRLLEERFPGLDLGLPLFETNM